MSNYILSLVLTPNKTSIYSFNNDKILSLLNEYIDSDIEEIQFYGGEPGLLSKKDLQLVFNKIAEFYNIKILTIHSNGMFFENYNLDDFNIPKLKLYIVFHLESLNNYYIIKNKLNYNNISITLELNTIYHLQMLYTILNDKPNCRITISFTNNFDIDNIVSIEYFDNWKKIIKTFDMKNLIDNSSDKISNDIFNMIIDKNITYNKFKMLLKIDKDKNNDRIKERQSIKIIKKLF